MDDARQLPGSGVEARISAFLHRKSAAAGVPLAGTFELTNRCNFNCRMCYVHNSDSNKFKETELSAGQWIDIAKAAADSGMLFLLLTGGEPLLRDDFEEIYENLTRLGLILSVNTNGSLLTGRNAALLERLPPSHINISLYGASDDTCKRVCGVSYLNAVKENIRRMKGAGLDVRLNVSLTPDNEEDIGAIVDYADSLDIKVRATTYMYPPNRSDGTIGSNPARFAAPDAGRCRARCDRLILSPEDFRRRAEAIASGDIIPCDDSCIDPEAEGSASRCRAGRTAFWVDAGGGMRMCGMTPVCADLTKSSFSEAWEKVRAETLKIRLPASCDSCNLRQLCPVCAAACYTETGDYGTKPEYLCDMTEATAREMVRLGKGSEL